MTFFNYINKILIEINKYNEYFKYIFIISWLLLLLYGKITLIRFLVFVVVLLVIYLYKYVINYINKENSELHSKLLAIGNNKLNKILYILINISILINIILYLIPRLEVQIYNLLYKLRKIGNIKLKRIIIIIIMSILILPIKYILNKFYKILNNFQNLTMYEILCKRMYGSVLSVLIFTDCINYIIINVCGSIINFYVTLYLVLVAICMLDYFINIINSWHNIIENINKNRMKASIISNLIIKIWNDYIDKDSFIEKYGNKLPTEWLWIFNIEEFENKIKRYKLGLLNHGKDILDLISCNKIFSYLLLEYKEQVSSLLWNLVTFEYYILYKKYNKDEVIKQTEEVTTKLNSLYEINYRMVQLLLYYIWDIDKETGLNSNIVIGDALGHVTLEWVDFGILVDYGINYDYSNIDINNSYNKQLFEYSHSIIGWYPIIPSVMSKQEYNSLNFIRSDIPLDTIDYYEDTIMKLLNRMRCYIDSGAINPTKFEEELAINVLNLKNRLYKEYADIKKRNPNKKYQYEEIIQELDMLLKKK